MAESESFFEKLLPYAQQVRKETGIPVSVTLAQWAIESGFESPDWVGGNNYAGITKGSPALGFRTYASIEEFTKDYINTIRLPYYDAVRSAAAEGAPIVQVAELLGRSPWDETGYTDPEQGYRGSSLVQTIASYNLLRYEATPEGTTQPASSFGESLNRFLYGTDPNTGKANTWGSYWSKWGKPYDPKEYQTLPDPGVIGKGAMIDPGKIVKDAVTSVTGTWWQDKAWWSGTAQKAGIILAGVLLIAFALWFLGKGTNVFHVETHKGE